MKAAVRSSMRTCNLINPRLDAAKKASESGPFLDPGEITIFSSPLLTKISARRLMFFLSDIILQISANFLQLTIKFLIYAQFLHIHHTDWMLL